MHIPYKKMHGTGNLILIVDQRDGKLQPPDAPELRKLGDEETGPGFDQLMWIGNASDGSSFASYRVFNADGSEVDQCGNGVRCVAKYLADGECGEFELQSPAGPIAARVFDDGDVAVSMGAPIFDPPRIPFEAEHSANAYELAVDETNIEIAAVSMGNPHAVVSVEDVSGAPVADLGPKIEHHDRFPEKTNVGFLHILDRQNIDLRVHERGVGETAACGTGACAAVVAGQRRGLLDEDVFVNLPGGQVVVSWRGGDTPVWLKGDAELINDGTLALNDRSTGMSEYEHPSRR
jgi:diaminopimelate epimerase